MGSLMEADKRTARRKGLTAAAVAGGSVALAAVGAPVFFPIVGLAGAGYLAYDWFMFRAKRGMRF
jgi:hypothetical protein